MGFMNRVSFTAYSVAILFVLVAVLELIIKTANWGAIAIVALVAAALLTAVGTIYRRKGASAPATSK
jgi:hypothetical protein